MCCELVPQFAKNAADGLRPKAATFTNTVLDGVRIDAAGGETVQVALIVSHDLFSYFMKRENVLCVC